MADINNWKNLPILQQPNYNKNDLAESVNILHNSDSVVDKDSIDNLLFKLSELQKNNAIILQIGDCAETFADFSEENVKKYIDFFVKNASKIKEKTNRNVIVIGRIAGQFAKPRSEDFETINGVKLPSYRGDIANSPEFDEKARYCDAKRLVTAYKQSKETVEIINGYKTMPIFVSHECLVIDYDSSFVKNIDNKFYCLSADLLWIGYRTAQIDGAHVDFLSKIENPVGLKIGVTANPEYLIKIINKLNPENKIGKVVLIARFGCNKISEYLKNLVDAVNGANLNVIWISDAMHGNGYKASNGYKTRSVKDICSEIDQFFNIINSGNSYPAGIHLEATPLNVTECVFDKNIEEEDKLSSFYKTTCDARLSEIQTDLVIENLCKLL